MDNESFPIMGSIDCSGQLCPVPILMTEEKMADLRKDEILEVIFTDPGAKPDLIAWCQTSGNVLLKVKNSKQKSFAYIRKGQ